MVAAAVAFGFPLAIWLGYARHVSSSGGLYSFTEAAAGHRVALAQAGLWALSYLLYILHAAIDQEIDARHVGTLVGREEQRDVRHVLGLAEPAEEGPVAHRLAPLLVLPRSFVIAVLLSLLSWPGWPPRRRTVLTRSR
jgi:hypothetical protein